MNPFISGIIEQSLIFSIMVMGIYITYKLLDFPDLSVDGSFTLGAAVSSILITRGMNPLFSLLIASLAGFMAGWVTGILNVKLKIQDLLSGILVMIGLYSINLRVMGKANIPLFAHSSIFTDHNRTIILVAFTAISGIIFTLFFMTKKGYLIKSVGSNESMIISLGVNTGNVKILALALSNMMVALSGGLMAQYQGFADINMGAGMIIVGLASIIMAIAMTRSRNINIASLCVIGAFAYRGAISLSLKMGFAPSDLKLISCIIVVLCIASAQKTSPSKGFRFNFSLSPKASLKGGANNA